MSTTFLPDMEEGNGIETNKFSESLSKEVFGIVPADWKIIPIGKLQPYITSGSRGWANFYAEDGDPFVRITNISHESIYLDLGNLRRVKLPPTFAEGTRTQLRSGDILISITADIGMIGFIEPSIQNPSFLNQHIALIRFNTDMIESRYVAYFLSSMWSQKLIRSFADTGAKAGMSLLTVGKLSLLLPKVEEQRAIATALSDLDDLIAALDKLIAKKRAIKQATMQQLLTGKIQLHGFDNEWADIAFADLADQRLDWSIAGGPFGSNLKASDYVSTGVRIIQLQNIGDGVFVDHHSIYTTPQKADELLSCNIFPGEIILSKMGDPVARACFVPEGNTRYLMSSDGIRLSVDRARFDSRFVLYMINSESFRRKAMEVSTGTTRRRIGLDELKRLPFSAPGLDQQRAIGELLSSMDAELSALEARRDKTRLIKQGMMQQLLTGRIRLVDSEQAP